MDRNAAFVQEEEILYVLSAGSQKEIGEMKVKFNRCLLSDSKNTLQVGENVICSILSELDQFMDSHPVCEKKKAG